MDSPTALGAAAVVILCVFAASLAYNSEGVSDPVPLGDEAVKDGEALFTMEAMVNAYRDGVLRDTVKPVAPRSV